MVDLADRRAIASMSRRHGVRAAARLGWHFLVEPAAPRAVVDAAEITGGDYDLEVGARPGVLTGHWRNARDQEPRGRARAVPSAVSPCCASPLSDWTTEIDDRRLDRGQNRQFLVGGPM